MLLLLCLVTASCQIGGDSDDQEPTTTPAPPAPSIALPSPTPAQSTSTPAAPTVTPARQEPLPAAVEAALAQAASDFGVSRAEVELSNYSEQLWPSTALGCPEPGTSYAQIVVPGYQVVVSIDQTVAIYHTGDGRAIRCLNPIE